MTEQETKTVTQEKMVELLKKRLLPGRPGIKFEVEGNIIHITYVESEFVTLCNDVNAGIIFENYKYPVNVKGVGNGMSNKPVTLMFNQESLNKPIVVGDCNMQENKEVKTVTQTFMLVAIKNLIDDNYKLKEVGNEIQVHGLFVDDKETEVSVKKLCELLDYKGKVSLFKPNGVVCINFTDEEIEQARFKQLLAELENNILDSTNIAVVGKKITLTQGSSSDLYQLNLLFTDKSLTPEQLDIHMAFSVNRHNFNKLKWSIDNLTAVGAEFHYVFCFKESPQPSTLKIEELRLLFDGNPKCDFI